MVYFFIVFVWVICWMWRGSCKVWEEGRIEVRRGSEIRRIKRWSEVGRKNRRKVSWIRVKVVRRVEREIRIKSRREVERGKVVGIIRGKERREIIGIIGIIERIVGCK